jgi:hypothetical protein
MVALSTCPLVQVVLYCGAAMPAYFDADIAGDGDAALASNQVIYFVAHLAVLDPLVRHLEPSASDHVLRAGWISFGDTLSVIGGSPFLYWRAPIWLDFERELWTPDPSTTGGSAAELFATRVRWHLQGVTSGHLYVFGA